MPLQNSGQISLNDLHVEAGGTSGTQASMNDSDIRGLLNAAANSQMTFSGFYGASNVLWTVNVTMGTWTFKGLTYRGYGTDFSGNQFGSVSDTTIDFINNGNSNSSFVALNNGTSDSFSFSASNVGTDTANSGFTSMKVHNTILTRASADSFSYNSPSNTKSWSWYNTPNPWETTTNGTTRTVVFT